MGTTVLGLILWLVCDEMLEVEDIDYETASSKRELKTVDIFDRAKKFTVLVECFQGNKSCLYAIPEFLEWNIVVV